MFMVSKYSDVKYWKMGAILLFFYPAAPPQSTCSCVSCAVYLKKQQVFLLEMHKRFYSIFASPPIYSPKRLQGEQVST